MQKYLVSIIIPFYKRYTKVDRAIQSALDQTYKNIEIILVDDNSYADLDFDYLKFESSKILLHKNKKNLGPGYSRNIGLKYAKGAFIVFLDSDDYFAPFFVEELVNLHLSNPDCIMCYAQTQLVGESSMDLGLRHEKIMKSNTILPDLLCHNRPWATGACMWKNSVLTTKKITWSSFRAWEDYFFDFSAGLVNNKITFSEKILFYYDIEDGEKLSSNQTNKEIYKTNVLKKMQIKSCFTYKIDNVSRKIIFKKSYNLAIKMLERNRFSNSGTLLIVLFISYLVGMFALKKNE